MGKQKKVKLLSNLFCLILSLRLKKIVNEDIVRIKFHNIPANIMIMSPEFPSILPIKSA